MLEKLKKIQDLPLKDKTVLVRADFDVALVSGDVADATKISAVVPTIKHLLENNCKIVLLSHLGDPEGKVIDELSLMPVRFELGNQLNLPIKFAHVHACSNSIKFMEKKEILLLENIRFNPKEKIEGIDNAKDLFKDLTSLCDFFICEYTDFETKDSSMLYLPQIIPSAVGFNVQNEILGLQKLALTSEKPYTLILGDTDHIDNFEVISNLIQNLDQILVGGKFSLIFLKAMGVETGDIIISDDLSSKAKSVIDLAKTNNVEIILPFDHVGINKNEEVVSVDTQQIPAGITFKDIGQRTLVAFREIIESSKTLLWSGVLGEFLNEKFSIGTESVGQYIALSSSRDSIKIVLDSLTSLAINTLRIKQKRFTLVSSAPNPSFILKSDDETASQTLKLYLN